MDISKLVCYGKTIFPYFKTTTNLLSNTSNLLKIGFQKTQNSLTWTRVRLTIAYHQNRPNCYHLKRKTTQVPSLITYPSWSIKYKQAWLCPCLFWCFSQDQQNMLKRWSLTRYWFLKEFGVSYYKIQKWKIWYNWWHWKNVPSSFYSPKRRWFVKIPLER